MLDEGESACAMAILWDIREGGFAQIALQRAAALDA
jgi:hypothetical protein